MIRLIAIAVFALAFTNSAGAMPAAPVHQPDGLMTQVAFGCGPFRTRVAGICVARSPHAALRAASGILASSI